MSKKLILITRIAVIVLVAAGLLFTILTVVDGNIGNKPTPEGLASTSLNAMMYIAYIALAITIVVMLIFPIVQMVSAPKKALKSLLGIVAIAVLWFICYTLSSNELSSQFLEKYNLSESTSALVGSFLYLTYIIVGLIILATIFMSVRGSIKK
ncbi:MAG: hypothetical protein LBH92_08390 [Bacteroidales bacterium]|jgi:hypothetical protein|nr:hypothetical protein [Bacteroidales bacterium]